MAGKPGVPPPPELYAPQRGMVARMARTDQSTNKAMRSLSPLHTRAEAVLPLPPSGLTPDRWALLYGDQFAEWMTLSLAERWEASRALWQIYLAINPDQDEHPTTPADGEDSP